MSNESDPNIDDAVREVVEEVIDEKIETGELPPNDQPDYDDDGDAGLDPDPEAFENYAAELEAAKEAFDGG